MHKLLRKEKQCNTRARHTTAVKKSHQDWYYFKEKHATDVHHNHHHHHRLWYSFIKKRGGWCTVIFVLNMILLYGTALFSPRHRRNFGLHEINGRLTGQYPR